MGSLMASTCSPLLLGDAFDLLASLRDGSVDCILSDPPYGTTDLAWDKRIDWPRFWAEARRVLSPTGLAVLFSAQPFTTELINSNRAWFRYELIWEKTCATGWLNANRRPLTAHENICVFAPRLHSSVYNPQKTPGKPYKGSQGPRAQHYANTPKVGRDNPSGERHPRSVLHFDTIAHPQHPTQKPVQLMRWLVRTYSQPGQFIVDPFAGVGSTGVAALLEGRRFSGSEREAGYFQVGIEKLAAAQAGAAAQDPAYF